MYIVIIILYYISVIYISTGDIELNIIHILKKINFLKTIKYAFEFLAFMLDGIICFNND